ncbi:MAG TPA: cyclic nucleotide-binding domain-containing protein [Myxococcaceae bacterium]|nr:cyclic nucleotide-binding domain-containing protein [Myxococcaceae bacterium]
MSDMSRQHEEALLDYEALAEAWARKGWLMRAIALCKVILRLEPTHEPTRRLLARLDARGLERLTPPGPAVPMPRLLESAPLLPGLDQEAFLSTLEALEPRVFQPGETIVEEGQPGDSMFALVEGSVEVVRTLKSGRQRTVAFLSEGDFFGEMSLLSDVPRLATVRAFERTAVLELTRERLERILERHPSVEEVLLGFHRERLLEDVLRGNPLLRTLSRERREALGRELQLCSRPAGALVLEQGHEVDALYLLLRGRCQVLFRHPDGREILLQTLGEGDLFGESSLMLGVPATATVRADTPCMLLRLDWGSCDRHLLSQPEVGEALSRLSNERLLNAAGLFWEAEGSAHHPSNPAG